jgi:probable phosphoglycerate mutase
MLVTLVRHEESLGNVLAKQARTARALRVETPVPNPELPLSEEGVERAADIGADGGYDGLIFDGVFSSTYTRAIQTMDLSKEHWMPRALCHARLDERLRDRELGCLDGLTSRGIEVFEPAEHHRRATMGKFYHRPAGGESWADVAFRMRAFLAEKEMQGYKSILIFSHDVPILTAIYIATPGITPEQIVARKTENPVENGSVTQLEV